MSIEPHYCETASEAFEFLDNLALKEDAFIFRVHTKEKYKLETTLHRHRKIPHSYGLDIDEMIDQFRVGLTRLGIAPFQSGNRLDWLEYARHYGVPTPVLDFTYSPYVALFFAFNGVRKKHDPGTEEYVVVNALNINNLAILWTKLSSWPPNNVDMKKYHQFLNPQGEQLFQNGFQTHCLQFIPFPGKFNNRMQRQQGALLFDTLQYEALKVKNLEELIKKHKEPSSPNPSPTLHKVFINKNCVSEIFAKLELMGISGGALFMNAEGVAQDVVNAYNYNSKIRYLRDIGFSPPGMKMILDIEIVVKGKPLHKILRKKYDVELHPIPGIKVEDSAWPDPKIPVSITCNFDQGYYLLNFELVELDTEENFEQEIKMYRDHGWKSPHEVSF